MVGVGLVVRIRPNRQESLFDLVHIPEGKIRL
jgi:hypothetical protein